MDSDRYAHESYEDKDVKKRLKESFPRAFSKGHLDRKKLLQIVSKDEEKMRILNSIIHPYVYKRTEEEIRRHPEKNFVIDMPLLLTSPFLDRCDFIIGVNAPLEIRKERLKKRGVDIEKALKLNSSFPIKELKKAKKYIFMEYFIIKKSRHSLFRNHWQQRRKQKNIRFLRLFNGKQNFLSLFQDDIPLLQVSSYYG